MGGLITHVEAIVRCIRAEPWPIEKVGRVYVVCGPTAGRRAGGVALIAARPPASSQGRVAQVGQELAGCRASRPPASLPVKKWSLNIFFLNYYYAN